MNNFKWEKKGKIFEKQNKYSWSKTHSTLPTPFLLNDKILRIFYTTRDNEQKSRISFFDVNSENLSNILYIHNKPILSLGEIGNYDDRGMTSSFVLPIRKNKYYFYLNGYNIANTARYRIAIGIAETDSKLEKFNKLYKGPIMDRSIYNPCGVATPFILFENNKYKMWYTSFIKWEIINNEVEPFYCIKYAVSDDAINWNLSDDICIDLKNDEGGIVRPSVININGKYYMWYSIRKNTNYRNNIENTYRIGFAESIDGKNWMRKDNNVGIDISKEGWDSEMIAYSYVFKIRNKIYMLYNGNGFGQSGIGYAILKTN